MQYTHIVPARFCSRPNRFIAEVELPDGSRERVHVKNTGRCRELLVPGARIYLEGAAHPARKTRFDLVAVEKGSRLINMDAQAPNRVFGEWARTGGFVPGLALLRPETAWGSSRFDFYWEAEERRGFVEVKGVTLEEDGAVFFPDAPTERGVKHLRGLQRAAAEGCEAWVIFVIQRSDAADFRPNDASDPAFGAALREAAAHGVRVRAVRCRVTLDGMTVIGEVPVQLD